MTEAALVLVGLVSVQLNHSKLMDTTPNWERAPAPHMPSLDSEKDT